MSKVSIQMDPIELIDIKADTTFALALEAHKRGHELFYYNPENLTYNNGIVSARGKNILKIQNMRFLAQPLNQLGIFLKKLPFQLQLPTAVTGEMGSLMKFILTTMEQ